ncbi:hypothetical protein M1L60_11500 [Actinoplanes sp. TRM 88003]|uniref:PknH-like extracellular domain-containing protein n=1 Tax=Paractinoplanes aksuensis TaxID=2939490 RepID=A0ABT1DK46_9ACTN|nr:hypothetical protein [Actinoplanes aksuensis]MCO8271218.1 hypothetical protein [Actinoplanes aksuensis]
MSNIEQAFAALSSDSERGLLLSGPELRRQAARRRSRTVAVTSGTAAVLVVGAVGAGWAIADNNRSTGLNTAGGSAPVVTMSSAPPVPSSAPATTRPTTAPATTAPPSSAPVTSEAPALPKSVPARALINKADANGDVTRQEDKIGPPEFCAKAKFPSQDQLGVSGSVMAAFRAPGTPAENIPDDTVYNTVGVYRGDGAQDYLADLRKATELCATGKVGDLDVQFDLLGSLGVGDESVLIHRAYELTDGEGNPMNNGSQMSTYIGAVRVGDAVTLIDARGYENLASNRAAIESLTKAATKRLEAWRD